ncbi:HNH endonuclease [Enterobacter hormaechei subsp. steigerwaltii]|nr:HNH endonuclease [Enterobacter hormaechei subsp. steigerwaltii]MCU3118395.1 HNH endonuclease [Enterobacter hormaechei subsp. steigerwaltii]MCU3168784.1 HNH endonuclease [Enterobacter hormaechei subsp. steigerwaltii]MCU3255684.1 HNH endonuclease [Enterobacter hormaechei subsp. steigerwaltii]MCU3388280.1 HNH endonuclease [Enterobacter hormaechei subsp. steigerwaltii]
MPPRTPKACRKRGCRQTTTDRSGYCDEHRGEGWRRYKPGQSRKQRGYGASWDKTRIRILKRDKGLCQECLRRGAITEASCVDHVRALAHGGDASDANLESLCSPCHSAKTARERLSGGQGGG